MGSHELYPHTPGQGSYQTTHACICLSDTRTVALITIDCFQTLILILNVNAWGTSMSICLKVSV